MKSVNRLLLLSLVLLLVSPALAGEGKVMGKGLGDYKTVELANLLGNPEEYVGKNVRVEGRIVDVCPRMGCWIDIAAEAGAKPIRFKVKDGVIIFPVEDKGKSVTAEGVFTKIELDEEEALAYARHMADERGEEFDPKKDEVSTVLYRIDGIGAVIR